MSKNLQCPSCKSVLGIIQDGKPMLQDMKAISKIAINMDDLTTDVKCHSCHNWSSIDASNKITSNYKMKAQEALYNNIRLHPYKSNL
jgi:hypothetical protein